jgi:hypothetical protein
MKSALSLLAVAVALGLPGPLRAEEKADAQIDFVHKLRAKGYHDLALEYLDLLKKKGDPELAAQVPVEVARTRLAMASILDPAQRLTQYAEARTELEKYVQANPAGPAAAKVRLEIARIASLQGQAQLAQAFRQEDEKALEEQARKAEVQFAQAGKELEAAAKALEELHKQAKDGTKAEQRAKKQLYEDLLAARLERGRNFLDQASTYTDEYLKKTETREKRAELVKQGKDILEAVAQDEGAGGSETSHLAVAWLIKAAYDDQDPEKAHNRYLKVMAATDKEARAAKRLAKLLYIQNIDKDITLKATGLKKLQFVQELCRSWLLAYSAFKNTPEGQAIRLELGHALIQEAMAHNDKLKTPPAQKLAKEAQTILTSLTESNSDYSRKAKQLSIQISLLQMGNRPIDKLKDFGECFLKAESEMARMDQVIQKMRAKPGDAKTLEAERKDHLRNVIAAFERGLQVADAKTPAAKMNDVRFYLTVSYMLNDELDKAAKTGEELARLKIPSAKSADAAAYALQAYTALLEKDAGNDAARKGMRDLATFLVEEKAKTWQNEPVVPIARYQLAVLALKERDQKTAIDHLEKLPRDFRAYTFAQCQAAFAALKLAKDAKSDEDKAAWQQRAIAALKRVPKLPADADPATATMFFAAQMNQGEILFNEGFAEARKGKVKEAAAKYGEILKFVDGLETQFKAASAVIEKEPQEQLRQTMDRLKKYALFGAAELEYRAGKYDQVLAKELTGGVLAQVQALGKAGAQISLPDYQMTGDILGLALRAQVQKGDIKSAKDTLDLIQRLTGPGGQVADPSAVLKSLLSELKAQIDELRLQGDKAKSKLDQTRKTFGSFIDELALQAGKKSLSRNDILFLANAYNSLEEYAKAAKLYGQVEPPKGKPPVLDPEKEGDEKAKEEFQKAKHKYEQERQAYWLMQVLYGSALRQSKQLAEAEKVFDRIVKAPDAAGKLLAEKERIHVLEDQERWVEAIKKWGDFISNPQLKSRLAQDAEAKKVFFNAYAHYAFSWYKYSQSPKVKGTDREKKYVLRAADYITKLENAKNQDGWRHAGPYLRMLLQTEPILNAAYKELKAKGK